MAVTLGAGNMARPPRPEAHGATAAILRDHISGTSFGLLLKFRVPLCTIYDEALVEPWVRQPPVRRFNINVMRLR